MTDTVFRPEAEYPVHVGQYGEDVEGETHIVLYGQVVDEPHGLGDDKDYLERSLIFDIYHPCIEASGYYRQPADPQDLPEMALSVHGHDILPYARFSILPVQ